MNTLAAFTSPLGSLHFAHPSATSALFQSAADRTTTTGSNRSEGPRRAPPPPSQAPPSPSSPTGRASRFGFKRRTARTNEAAGNTTTTASGALRAPLEISSPVFVSSSNPMACTAFLNSLSAAAAAEKEEGKLDVPLSPVSLRRESCASGTTTPLDDDPERSLVGTEEIERRMSEWDDEHRAERAVRVARADGRVSDELKRVGL